MVVKELERKFRARLDRALKAEGLNIVKWSVADTYAAGRPDWQIMGARGVLFLELKREGENPRPNQRMCLRELVMAGVPCGIARPIDGGLFEFENWSSHEKLVFQTFQSCLAYYSIL